MQRPTDAGPGTVAELLGARLAVLVDDVVSLEQGARDDRPDAVHQMRVGARRVRSLLATYRPLLNQDVTEPLRADLGRLTSVLGDVRDPEVLRQRLITALDALPAGHQRGNVRERIASSLTAEHSAAHATLLGALDSPRHRELVQALRGIAARVPLVQDDDTTPVAEVARRRVRHDWRRLERLVDELPVDPSPRDLDVQLHDVRKAAKRVRYAAETAESVVGARIRRLRVAVARFQERLGDHQDALVTEAYVGRLAAEAAADNDDVFTYGVLVGRASVEVELVAAAFPRLWARTVRASRVA